MAVDAVGQGLQLAPKADTDEIKPKGHPLLGYFVVFGLLFAAVPAFVFLAPPSTFEPIPLLAALLAISVFSYFGSIRTNATLAFSAGTAVDLLALVFFGPIPAAGIAIATELLAWSFERNPISGTLASMAGHAWAAIVGALVISGLAGWPAEPTSIAALGAIALAGIVHLSVDFTLTRVPYAVIRKGQALGPTFNREFFRGMLPTSLPMVALAVGTAFLYTEIGILALGIFAAITLIPQLLLPVLLRPRPVENLSHADAVVLYSQAIASVLKLDSTMKEVLSDAAQHIEGPEAQANGGKIKASYSGEHFHDVVEAVLYYREHWDSGGEGFAGVGGEMIPLSSRILAVSDQWAQLTASGVWTVTHAQAMNKLQEHSGAEYDPRIVSAAAKVVDEERMGLTDNQPQLHEVPLPQLVRKVPRLSGLLTANRTGA